MTSDTANKAIQKAPFGRTGHESTRVIFGAAGLSALSQEESDQVIATLDEYGINHLDTAASYGDSELRLAPLLSTRRDEFFLATKTGERAGDAARAELERSLTRLGVDHVDLIQLHNLVEQDEWEVAHGAGGAVEALVKARDEGLVRFIGVTGHGTRIPSMHLKSLERFDFDSVLLPCNWTMLANPDYREDFQALQAVCAERNVAMQTIKSIARRRWADSTEGHQSWYEPIYDVEALRHAVSWILGQPQLFLNSSSDTTLLRETLEAALGTQSSPTDEQMAADTATEGIVALFDGTELERI